MRTYSDILSWMYKQLPVFQKIGSPAYKPGFDRINKLLNLLKSPQKEFKSIHVAGTGAVSLENCEFRGAQRACLSAVNAQANVINTMLSASATADMASNAIGV